jgi:hypothetical protein
VVILIVMSKTKDVSYTWMLSCISSCIADLVVCHTVRINSYVLMYNII